MLNSKQRDRLHQKYLQMGSITAFRFVIIKHNENQSPQLLEKAICYPESAKFTTITTRYNLFMLRLKANYQFQCCSLMKNPLQSNYGPIYLCPKRKSIFIKYFQVGHSAEDQDKGDIHQLNVIKNLNFNVTPQTLYFSPASHTRPIKDLLCEKNEWCWESPQREAFQRLNTELSSPHVLAPYSPTAETCVSADTSSFGLGTILSHNRQMEHGDASCSSPEACLRRKNIMHRLKRRLWQRRGHANG